MIEGVLFLSVLAQRSMQKHVHMLQKRSLTEKFVVEDLSGEGGCRTITDVLSHRAAGAQPRPSLVAAALRPGLSCRRISGSLCPARSGGSVGHGAR